MPCDAALQFSLHLFPRISLFVPVLPTLCGLHLQLVLVGLCFDFASSSSSPFLGFFVAFSKICILLDLRKDLRLLQRRNAPFVGDVCINLPKTACDPIAFRDCYSNVSDCNVCQDKHVAVA